MNWKNLLMGVAVGFAAGVLTSKAIDRNVSMSPEKILQDAKNALQKNGKIIGSWIVMKTEPYEKNELTYTVYKGGLTRKTGDQNEQFEFIADAMTGTILEVLAK
jgi:predicted small secreted protein